MVSRSLALARQHNETHSIAYNKISKKIYIDELIESKSFNSSLKPYIDVSTVTGSAH